MTTEEKAKAKSKTHTIYKLKDGSRVPGVTTITGVMDKPALVRWANNLGLQGIDSSKYVDEVATIGSLAHYLCECWLKSETPDIANYTPNQLDGATKCFGKFRMWIESKKLTLKDFALSEEPLVSEKYRFGGTVDICGTVDGKATLIDIKTAKAIYGEHKTQVAGGYRLLLEDTGYPVENITILRIGRNDEEGFEEVTVSKAESDLHVKRFLICQSLYEINKECK